MTTRIDQTSFDPNPQETMRHMPTTQTASLPTPSLIVVGTHGSYSVGSDTYPCTVVEVSKSGHRVVIETDETTKWTAFPDSRGVEFARREGGRRMVFTRRADGHYRMAGANFGGLSLSGWYSHQDPSF